MNRWAIFRSSLWGRRTDTATGSNDLRLDTSTPRLSWSGAGDAGPAVMMPIVYLNGLRLWRARGPLRSAFDVSQFRVGSLFDAFEDDVCEEGFGADAGGVPKAFAFAFGGIAPGGLAAFEAFLDGLFRFAEHDWNVFVGMEAVADEEWNHNEVFRGRNRIAVADARVFFHEDGVDFGVAVEAANDFDLAFDGFAGVFVVAGAMPGNEQGGLTRLRCGGEGMFLHDITRAGEQDLGHALVSADGAAIVNGLVAALQHAFIFARRASRHAEFARDDFFGEIAFADKEGNDKNS